MNAALTRLASPIALLAAFVCPAVARADAPPATRPNVLWIMAEDWGPDLSCFGTQGIHTPHLDQMAAEGTRFTQAFTTSPVCSTSRSAMMTGFHQNYIGAHQHRTADKQPLPHGIRPLPHLLEDAGYFTCLMDRKTDCNFTTSRPLFMGKDWKERAADQPFFAQVTFNGTHRIWKRDSTSPIATEDVEIPPYYPDTEFVRRDWANGLEQMQLVDRQIGRLLQRLDDEGLSENTLVFFIGDNGRCHIRGKQFLYDGGIRVPLFVRWPGHVAPAQVRDDVVMSIDISATILSAAGIDPGYEVHGRDLLDTGGKKRGFVFAARDKMDDTHDAIRAIRSRDFKLIHNLMPERAYCQYNQYKESMYPVLALMNVMNLKGQLTPPQAAFMAPRKPEFELYDLRTDPHEVHNLADDPDYSGIRKGLAERLATWRREVIEDQGVREDFRDGGWPADYPTKSLAEWEAVLATWRPWVSREPGAATPHPFKRPGKKARRRQEPAPTRDTRAP